MPVSDPVRPLSHEPIVKPCPFCQTGENLHLHGWFHIGTKTRWFVWCDNGKDFGGCGAQGPCAETKSLAVERWNRRADLDLSDLRDALERIESSFIRVLDHMSYCQHNGKIPDYVSDGLAACRDALAKLRRELQ